MPDYSAGNPRTEHSPGELADILMLRPGRKTESSSINIRDQGPIPVFDVFRNAVVGTILPEARSMLQAGQELEYLGYTPEEIQEFERAMQLAVTLSCDQQKYDFMRNIDGNPDIEWAATKNHTCFMGQNVNFWIDGVNATLQVDLEKFEQRAFEFLMEELERLQKEKPELFFHREPPPENAPGREPYIH